MDLQAFEGRRAKGEKIPVVSSSRHPLLEASAVNYTLTNYTPSTATTTT